MAVAAMILSASCSADEAGRAAPSDAECPDLRFGDRYYDEWREFQPAPVLQEVGDAIYPACKDADNSGPDLGGHAATDVWLLEGVEIEQAVLGYRQDTETTVIFLRRGLDPDTVRGLPPQPPD